MPVWTVSQRFSHLQWRRLFKELWGRPTTTADFGSSLWKVPYTSYVCLLEDRPRYVLVHDFPTEAMLWIKEVEMVVSVDDLRSSCSVRGFQMPNFEVVDAKIASALNRIIQNTASRKRSVWSNKKPKKRTFSFVEDRSLTLIYEYFRVTNANDSVENYADLFTTVRRNDDI